MKKFFHLVFISIIGMTAPLMASVLDNEEAEKKQVQQAVDFFTEALSEKHTSLGPEASSDLLSRLFQKIYEKYGRGPQSSAPYTPDPHPPRNRPWEL